MPRLTEGVQDIVSFFARFWGPRKPNIQPNTKAHEIPKTFPGNSTSGNHLWSLVWIQKTCLSAQILSAQNLSACPIRITRWAPTDQFLGKRRRPMPQASGRSPRGGDRHGTNYTSSRALCVQISELTFSIPIREMGRAAAIAPSRATEKLFVKSIFKWNWVKFIFLLNSSCAAMRDKRQ